jgi:hypothetical protein
LEIFLREVRRLSKRQFLAKVCLYRWCDDDPVLLLGS